jgi:hypothetical protein
MRSRKFEQAPEQRGGALYADVNAAAMADLVVDLSTD